MEWTGYPFLDCYDYKSTCGAKNDLLKETVFLIISPVWHWLLTFRWRNSDQHFFITLALQKFYSI